MYPFAILLDDLWARQIQAANKSVQQQQMAQHAAGGCSNVRRSEGERARYSAQSVVIDLLNTYNCVVLTCSSCASGRSFSIMSGVRNMQPPRRVYSMAVGVCMGVLRIIMTPHRAKPSWAVAVNIMLSCSFDTTADNWKGGT
eukprot:GHUV01033575.1.p1 GENE.GHUV01033575.1~~GHUV01033575.1.p1  ORF type:complete len:142 (-),score=19.71 GHUV01033575.1:63-488(-)